MKLPDCREMQALDSAAINDFHIPGIVLMENAGLGTVRMIENHCGSCEGTFAIIFIGPGNNGGDGLVIGRHLHQRGCLPIFFFLVPPETLKGNAAVNLRIVQKLNLPFHLINRCSLVEKVPALIERSRKTNRPCCAVIDAIFGIGLKREVESHFAAAIRLINRRDFSGTSTVVAVDTPSGLDSNTGKPLGTCVKADFTATYCCAKPGHFVHGGSPWTGQLEVIDIGIPPETVRHADIRTELLTGKTFKQISSNLPRKKTCHKGDHGHLLILAGSAGKTGAAILAARGGLRSGAGLVSVFAPSNLTSIYEISLIEAMTISLPQSRDFFLLDDLESIMENMAGKEALIVGPGLGTDKSTIELVLHLYHQATCPLILDADAINCLALSIDHLGPPAGPRILTPHPGELSRLINRSTENVQNNRIESAVEACNLFKNPDHDIIMVLKGAGTLITTSGGYTFINRSGNPGMAAAGMGDVLSGVIGALICQGMSVCSGSNAGVFLHGCAGDALYRQSGHGYTATELADRIPLALKELLHR
ncbi:MAG: NAD(P)H-hydrate dehydratase [Deltaproteobacteria bacterium]|nr:NAD(P)H-hydrate dehydratase [Deltaproteobacteria bacterium]MBW2658581.1 NAD(P)H-hydrate dehydratase [Deltaproteobacteria bacterium]